MYFTTNAHISPVDCVSLSIFISTFQVVDHVHVQRIIAALFFFLSVVLLTLPVVLFISYVYVLSIS